MTCLLLYLKVLTSCIWNEVTHRTRTFHKFAFDKKAFKTKHMANFEYAKNVRSSNVIKWEHKVPHISNKISGQLIISWKGKCQLIHVYWFYLTVCINDIMQIKSIISNYFIEHNSTNSCYVCSKNTFICLYLQTTL